MALAETIDMRWGDQTGRLDQPITDARAWTRDTIDPQDCLIPVGDEGRAELLAMADAIERNPLKIKP